MSLQIVPNKALARRRDSSYEWIDVNMRYLDELLQVYRDVEIGLVDTVLQHEYTLFARQCDPHHVLINNLIAGDIKLPSMRDGLPTLEVEESFYRPMLKGFDYIKLCKRNQHPSHPVDASEAEDLIVSKMRHGKRQQCLFTANGFYVRAIHGAEDSRLVGAARIMYHNADTSCGMLHMPGTVSYEVIDPATAEFTDDGQLYVPLSNPNDTPAIVIGGRLFIAGIDNELRRGGANFALFRFDHTFIMDWLVRYAPLLYPGQDFDAIDTARLTSVEMKRVFLQSEYCFRVVMTGGGYYVRDTGVERHWWNEHRVTNLKDASDYYGLVMQDNGRVYDYWGVYWNVANLLHHTNDRWDRGDRFHAHTTQYMREGITTDKRNMLPAPQYFPARARYYCKRK